ncbi:MAG: type IV toxin-antitoxin system AbiEi family antitoxin domain-containing protein [Halioglobus sp.]|nr:type IV toxin-antitoxin system AbiEi family antitoxin domain-containing protein [Halioglobus sp.]
MDRATALKRFSQWDRQGRFVFTRADLAKLFHEDSARALKEGLRRLVAEGLLERPARGVYIYALAHSRNSYMIEQIARALRRGEYNYVSLESALSEYGAISQVPLDRLTVMTSGRKGIYKTPYGTIEFVHTKRPISELLNRMTDVGRPLHLATPQAAWGDLKRVGRNTHLVDESVVGHE